jgi:hypothetical protein
MIKYYLSWAGWPSGVIALAVSLAACGGSATPASPVEEVAASPTASEAIEVVATEEVVVETATPVESEVAEVEAAPQAEATVAEPAPVSAAGPARCEPINPFAAVTETDWAQGSAEAAVTIVEYGDFQ